MPCQTPEQTDRANGSGRGNIPLSHDQVTWVTDEAAGQR